MHFSHHLYSANGQVPTGVAQKPLSRFQPVRLVADLITAGLLLVLAGFGIVVVSVLSEARKTGAEVRGGGVVMVGPIPIIFGSDAKWASIAMILAIVLVLLSIVLYLV